MITDSAIQVNSGMPLDSSNLRIHVAQPIIKHPQHLTVQHLTVGGKIQSSIIPGLLQWVSHIINPNEPIPITKVWDRAPFHPFIPGAVESAPS